MHFTQLVKKLNSKLNDLLVSFSQHQSQAGVGSVRTVFSSVYCSSCFQNLVKQVSITCLCASVSE
jgi:hypothetical protein